MARQYSRARILTARLNPINSAEKKSLDYLQKAERDGFNFKQVVVDAINHRAGHTPEMFDDNRNLTPAQVMRLFEDRLDQFAQELLNKINTGEVKIVPAEEDADREDGLSAFARNFSQGVLQRQRINAGQETEE